MSKVVLINGASRGIGEAIAKNLYTEGCPDKYKLVLTSRRDKLDIGFADEPNVFSIKCDSTDYNQVKQTVLKAIDKFGAIDILINVVGRLKLNTIIDETEAQLDEMINTNLKNYWYFIKEVLPVMQKQKRGFIINISSMQAIRAFQGKSSYAMSKSAVNSLTEAVNRENNRFGIRATAICPGFVKTDMVDGLDWEGEQLLSTSDIAETVKYLLNLSSVAIVQELHIERKLW